MELVNQTLGYVILGIIYLISMTLFSLLIIQKNMTEGVSKQTHFKRVFIKSFLGFTAGVIVAFTTYKTVLLFHNEDDYAYPFTSNLLGICELIPALAIIVINVSEIRKLLN